jgi:release factor glutamine methyltransferase
MSSFTKKISFEDQTFRVNEHVYEPAEDSFLFAENLTVRAGDKVVDVGTGCGILGIIAAAKASQVVAADINPWAVRCAEENAKLNHVANKMFFLNGDLFSPIKTGEQFDMILFNAPYLPSEEAEKSSWLEWAWAGGASGREIIHNFVGQAPDHLRANGEILLLQSTLSGIEATLKDFSKKGLNSCLVAEQNVPFFETIVLLKAWFAE